LNDLTAAHQPLIHLYATGWPERFLTPLRPAMLFPSNPENGCPFALNQVHAAHNWI
jgi:hypothetical protein